MAKPQQRRNVQRQKCRCCPDSFNTFQELQTHQISTGHCYCRSCKVHFPDRFQHVVHVRTLSHAEQYQCCDCKREYMDQQALTTHCCVCDRIYHKKSDLKSHMASSQRHINRARSSRSEPYLTGHHKCSECRMTFDDPTSLSMHKKSKHKPKRILRCPIGEKCKKYFASASALLNHLESGACKSGMNRMKLNQLIIAHDQDCHITCLNAKEEIDVLPKPASASLRSSLSSWQNVADADSQVVLTPGSQDINDSQSYEFSYSMTAEDGENDDDDDSDSLGGVLLTPSTGSIPSELLSLRSPEIRPDDRLPETDQGGLFSLNLSLPRRIQCPLCPPGERTFNSAKALQMHTQSPVHAPKIFHCPMAFVPNVTTSIQRKQEKRFSTLSGLTMHLENGACRGGIETFRNAFKYVEDRLRMLGCGGIKLLVEPKAVSSRA